MVHYWRSGLAVLIALTGVGVALAYGLPAVYEATAVLEADTTGAPVRRPSVAEEVSSLVTDAGRLQKLLHDGPAESPLRSIPVDVLAKSIEVTSTSERTIRLAYRAGHAEAARSGCTALAELVVAHFSKDSQNTARAELERHTKELADFVSAHPDLLLEGAPSTTPQGQRAPAPFSDVALSVLKKQKARLEAELAETQAAAAEPSKTNPYDDAEPAPNVPDLEKRLAQVNYAIYARQRAASAPAAGASSASPAAANQPALQAEWRRLILAVVDAEPASAKAPASTKIARAPTLPERPLKPNRRVFMVVGFLSGVWLAVLTALMQLVRDDRRKLRAQQRRTRSDRPPRGATSDPPRTGPSPVSPAGTLASADAAAKAANPAGPARPSPAPPAGGLKSPETRIGMMDPALIRTQIGGTPQGLLAREQPKTPEVAGVIPATAEPVEPPGTRRYGSKPASDPPVQPAGTRPAAAPEPVAPARVGAEVPGALGVHRSEEEGPAGTQRIPFEVAANLGKTQPVLQADKRPSSNPPRPDRGSGRPSGIPLPGVNRTSDLFSPPPVLPRPPATGVDIGSVPDTQRFGSLDESAQPKTLSPPPPPPSGAPRANRPDTKYSFVDRARQSRPPLADRSSGSAAPAEPRRSQPPAATAVRPSQPVEDRRTSAKPGTTASATPPPVEAEVWNDNKANAPRPVSEELIAARPAPPSWRLQPSNESVGNGVLGGLRDQIFEFAKRGPFVLGVTSEYNSLESKTIVAARLSMMLAEDGRVRVLLLEANFDFPGVHRVLAIEMPPGAGFSQQLRSRLRGGVKKPWTVVRCTDRLDVLAEGLVRSPGVLLSQEFADAVAELRRYYDVIVIDSPIAGLGIETKPIDSVSDGVAVVAPTQAALRETLNRAMKWFGQKKLMVSVPGEGGVG